MERTGTDTFPLTITWDILETGWYSVWPWRQLLAYLHISATWNIYSLGLHTKKVPVAPGTFPQSSPCN